MPLGRHARIGDGRMVQVEREILAAARRDRRCRRAALCSAGRTGSCGAGCPARCPSTPKWTTNSDGEKRLRSQLRARSAAALRESAEQVAIGVDDVGVAGDRVEVARASRSRSRTPVARSPSVSIRDHRIAQPHRAAEPLEMARPSPRPAGWCRPRRTTRRRPAPACGSAHRSRWSSSDCRRPAACGSDSASRSFSFFTKLETIE